MYVGFIILSIIVALIRKGKFSNIKYFRFNLWYLLIAAFLIYVGYVAGTIAEVQFVLDYSYWIYFVVYVLVMITVVFNLNNIWSYILVVGIGLNFTATFLNGGKMPILQSALDMAGIKDNAQLYLSYFGATNQLTLTDPYVMGLCKILGIPLGAFGLPISAGDIIIAISMFFIVQKMMVVPQAKKATPQERLAYTGQLSYTSEYNLDEIAKAARESNIELDEPEVLSPKLSDTQDIKKSTGKNILDDDFLLEEDISTKTADDIQLALGGENIDLQDDDEFDNFLQKLDNINKFEEEEEYSEFKSGLDDDSKEEFNFDIPEEDTAAEDEKQDKALTEPEPDYSITESEEENENIAKLLDDLDRQNFGQDYEEQITEEDLQLSQDDEIQNIVSELIDTDTEESAVFEEEDEALKKKSDEADEMLSYMLDIFDKHKKARIQAAQEQTNQDDEDEILKSVLNKTEPEPLISKPKIDLFDDGINADFDNDVKTDNADSDEEIDTTNPFVIKNGRIVENPNYKFRKTTDTDIKAKETQPKEEPVIAFDSTQNLEFIRKEIFAELKRQEEAESEANKDEEKIIEDYSEPALSIPQPNDEIDEEPASPALSKPSGKEEYERVEFEIDGKTMYVWIKK